MRYSNALFVAAFVLFFILGLAAHVNSFDIPTCPSDNANILINEGAEDEKIIRMKKGMVSDGYTALDLEKTIKAFEEAGESFDLEQCPPSAGTLSFPIHKAVNGMIMIFEGELTIPQGFFDTRENWMNDQEASDHVSRKNAQPI